jgi:hypothetical protein
MIVSVLNCTIFTHDFNLTLAKFSLFFTLLRSLLLAMFIAFFAEPLICPLISFCSRKKERARKSGDEWKRDEETRRGDAQLLEGLGPRSRGDAPRPAGDAPQPAGNTPRAAGGRSSLAGRTSTKVVRDLPNLMPPSLLPPSWARCGAWSTYSTRWPRR